MKREKWLIALLIILMGGKVLAGGMTVTGTVMDHTGKSPVVGAAVECWDGSITATNTSPYATGGMKSPPPLDTVTTDSSGNLTNKGSTVTSFYDDRHDVSVTVKAWEGAAGATWYGYSSYSIGGVSAPPGYATCNITTDYKAAAPDKPTVSAGGYNLKWDDATKQFLVSFTLSVSPGSGWKSEGVSYSIAVKKAADDWSAAKTGSGSSWTIVETNTANPYFVGGGTYNAYATATNMFGSTAGDPITFTIPAAAAGGGPVSVTYSLVKQSGGLGVNSIGMPFDAPMTYVSSDGKTTASVSTLQDLLTAISAAGVAATAYWDNTSQQLSGNTYSSGAAAPAYSTAGYDPAKVTLQAGKAYYVSVSNSISFSLRKP